MISPVNVIPSFSFFDPICNKAKKCGDRLNAFFSPKQAAEISPKQRKITCDTSWKTLLKQFQEAGPFSWENAKKEILDLLQECDPKLNPEVNNYFRKFLTELKPDDALASLEGLLLASVEKDSLPLKNLAFEAAETAFFDQIIKEKTHGKYSSIEQWADAIAKDLSPRPHPQVKLNREDSSPAHVITSFFPNLARTFIRAFSLFDSARPPESLYDYGALAALYFHFFSMPYYLFVGLSSVITNPWVVLAAAVAILAAAVASLYIYLKFFQKCPTEVMFCENLSQKFKKGGIKPILGRDAEYAQVLSLLALGQQDKGGNVVIVGKPGVGKSVFMEGLAAKLPQAQVFKFNNWDITEQDGRFRNPGGRMRMAFDEVKGFEDKTLFCFDELGKEVDKNEGLANYLRTVLPNSKVRFIATMTAEQWQKLKQNNSKDGFEERFVPIYLEPTDQKTTETILQNRVKHQTTDVSISNSALKKIVDLTQKSDANDHEQPRCAKRKLDELVGQARLFNPETFESQALLQAREELNHLLHLSESQGSPLNDPFSETAQKHLNAIEEHKNRIQQLKIESDSIKAALSSLKKHLDLLRKYEAEYKQLAMAMTQGKCDELAKKRFAFAQFVAAPALNKKIQSLKFALPPEAQKVCLYIDDYQVEHFLAEKQVNTVR